MKTDPATLTSSVRAKGVEPPLVRNLGEGTSTHFLEGTTLDSIPAFLSDLNSSLSALYDPRPSNPDLV